MPNASALSVSTLDRKSHRLSALVLVGIDWTVPDFGTLSRRPKILAVNISYRGSNLWILETKWTAETVG